MIQPFSSNDFFNIVFIVFEDIASREVPRERCEGKCLFFRGREIDEQRYERRHRRGSDFFSISKKQKVPSFYSKKGQHDLLFVSRLYYRGFDTNPDV